MAAREERMGSYSFRVITEELVKPKLRDILRFNVTVCVRFYANYFSRPHLMRVSTLFQTSIPITCESLLENYQGFLQSSLSNSRSRYFTPEILGQISQRVVSRVQNLLEFQSYESTDLESQEFPLTLVIFNDVWEDEESEDDEEILERAAIEQSMQQPTAMIPASNEVISSINTFTYSLSLKPEECNICMEKFNAEDDDENIKLLSSMPCNHVFHHQCIVKWLQTSHTCPLCRFRLPTTEY